MSAVFGLLFKCHLLTLGEVWRLERKVKDCRHPLLPLEILVYLEGLQWNGKETSFSTCGAGTRTPPSWPSQFGIPMQWIWTGPICWRLSGDVGVAEKSDKPFIKLLGEYLWKPNTFRPPPRLPPASNNWPLSCLLFSLSSPCLAEVKQFIKLSSIKEARLFYLSSYQLILLLPGSVILQKNQNVPKRHKLHPREPRKLVLKSTAFVKIPFSVSPFRESSQFLFFKKRKNDSDVTAGLRELEIYGGKKITSRVQLVIKRWKTTCASLWSC